MDCAFVYCPRVAEMIAYKKNACEPPLHVCKDHYDAIEAVTLGRRKLGEPIK